MEINVVCLPKVARHSHIHTISDTHWQNRHVLCFHSIGFVQCLSHIDQHVCKSRPNLRKCHTFYQFNTKSAHEKAKVI